MMTELIWSLLPIELTGLVIIAVRVITEVMK